ncbi:MAG: aldehyde dehydrogenase family protein [Melioribacteraceae bacterium]|jgi:acyl-CoA reductase-like NAD-dependent aldehyde dehydrogenase|nr:aldehyde dehydrogenase family protein [Melioribacteraceae bacterium]
MKTENKTISYNPATREQIGESQLHTLDDLSRMMSESKVAQKEWQKLSVKQRGKRILKIKDYLVDNLDSLSKTISDDNGKVRFDALATEVFPAVMATKYYVKNAPKFLKEKKISASSIVLANKRSRIRFEPMGVVGIISPWNYPFAIPYSEVIMALLAGNGVILKTATETLMVGTALRDAINSADLPKGLFQFINIPGRIAGDGFLKSGIDKLFFTGSVPVGKLLMKQAADTLTPVSLELGGNDSMLVCEDADLDRAVNGAVWAGLSNAGQSCGGVERIYIHQNIYTQFMNLLKIKVESLRIGTPSEFNTDVGVMTTEKQVNAVKLHLDDALKNGAILFAESKVEDNSTNIFTPKVVTNVNHNMLMMKEETFGPLLGVMKVDNMNEAIDLANDSFLGLTGSVWSKNHKRAMQLASKIKAGTITINDHLMSHGLAETSWGGFKESGVGRTHGELGFMEMVQPQTIVNDILPGVKKNIWWHPYSKDLYEGLKSIIYLFYGNSFTQKTKNLLKPLPVIPRIFRK